MTADSVGVDAAGQLREGAYFGWAEGGCTTDKLQELYENSIVSVRAQHNASSRPVCRRNGTSVVSANVAPSTLTPWLPFACGT